MSIDGTDVSGFQPGNVNYGTNVFAYVKASEGVSIVNANHDAQVAEARAKGMVVGHYHFPDWNTPEAEAAWFVQCAKWQVGDFVVIDIENSPNTPWPADPVTWCVRFCAAVFKAFGIEPFDYIGPTARKAYDWRPLAARGGGLISPEYNNVGPSDPSPWPFTAMWQNSDEDETSGGDDDQFAGTRAQLVLYGTPSTSGQGGGVTPISGVFMALTDAQQSQLYTWMNNVQYAVARYLNAPIGEVPAKSATAVWATQVMRAGGNDSALQEVADAKTDAIANGAAIAALSKTVAGLPTTATPMSDAQVTDLANKLAAVLPAADIAALAAQLAKK